MVIFSESKFAKKLHDRTMRKKKQGDTLEIERELLNQKIDTKQWEKDRETYYRERKTVN